MDVVETVARATVAAAGALVRAAWTRPRHVGLKGPVDLVTETDREVETFVVAALRQAFPRHRIVGEEGISAEQPPSDADGHVWYLDPVDGTTNFAHGFPHVAVSLALAPGFAAGLLEPDVVVVAASGTSGAGKSLKPHLLGSEVMGSMSPYGVGGVHRHTPEMEQNLSAAAGEAIRVSFTPTLAPMARGILATATARLGTGSDAGDVRAAWVTAYADEPFVHVLPEGRWPRTADTLGANTVQLQLAVDRRAGRVVVVTAIDNLTKGTAGGAVQSANLALDLPETQGLPMTGLAP